MSQLRQLFNPGAPREIGTCMFIVHQVGYEQFEDAIDVGGWLHRVDPTDLLTALNGLRGDSPTRQCIDRLVAGCLSLPPTGAPVEAAERRLSPADLRDMPITMVGEALAVVLEVNADFFFRSIAAISRAAIRLGWTGLASPSNSSAPDTSPTESAATPSPSSRAS